MDEKIKELIKDANKNIHYADQCSTYEGISGYALSAIANSLTAIAMMFATDYEKTIGGEEDGRT